MGRRWTDGDRQALLAALPLTPRTPPTWDALRRVGRQLDRSADACLAVWEDAERYLRGAAYSEASPELRAYLDRHPEQS